MLYRLRPLPGIEYEKGLLQASWIKRRGRDVAALAWKG
jgi:hypothetical protein